MDGSIRARFMRRHARSRGRSARRSEREQPPESSQLEIPSRVQGRQFACLLLYGVELSSDRRLDAVIPDLSGSSVRLIAQTRFVPRFVEITVKTLTGNAIRLSFPVSFTVEELKEEMESREGIPLEQRLIVDGRQLENARTLADYGVKSGCTVHLVLRFSGGGGPPVDFADLSYEDKWLVELQLDEKAPEWRIYTRGLNVEGECENRACRAFQETVIHPNGFNAFNLTCDTDVKCPLCKQSFKPITCGFYECVWKFDGNRSQDEFSISSTWKSATGESYHRFDTDKAGSSVQWDSLLIVAKSRRVAIAARIPAIASSPVVRKGSVCSICWSVFGLVGAKSITTGDCGHSFHRECIAVWSDWCNNHDTLSSCPLCHKIT